MNYTTEEQANALWFDLSAEEKLDKVARTLWPELFRRPPPPQRHATDDLFDENGAHVPYWGGYNETALRERFNALSQYCYAFTETEKEKRREAWDNYFADAGQKLPLRFYNEDARIIETATGSDITDLIAARKVVYDKGIAMRAAVDDEAHYAAFEALEAARADLAKLEGRQHKARTYVPPITETLLTGTL